MTFFISISAPLALTGLKKKGVVVRGRGGGDGIVFHMNWPEKEVPS